MRLVYLCADRGVAYGGTKGAAVHVAEITRALAGEGEEVLLLVAARDDAAGPPPPGLTVEVAPATPDGLARRLADFRAQALVERLSLRAVDGSVAARAVGIPHLVELNAPLTWEAAIYRGLEKPEEAERLEAGVLAGAAMVFAVSRPLAAWARARGAARVEVLPNAAAVDRFPRRPTASVTAAALAGPVRAVLAGTLRPWHGVAVVADAWRQLGRAAPPLLVLGDGPGREELEAVGAEVTGRVPHHRVPSMLAACHIGLAPYAADAPLYFSPLKLFDYLAAGLAVVAGDLPGVSDIVDRGTAVVVPPGDAGALALAVQGLVDDPGRRDRLGRAGRRLAEEHHTWSHRARRVLAVTAELTSVDTAP